MTLFPTLFRILLLLTAGRARHSPAALPTHGHQGLQLGIRVSSSPLTTPIFSRVAAGIDVVTFNAVDNKIV